MSHVITDSWPANHAFLGELDIRRALPVRQRRLVGPWCFLDRYGPLTFSDSKPMDVAPHPHIGLQTVSWHLDGEVLHRDSLGYEAMVRPGELNVMTSGRGISHSEETPRRNSGVLNGVQLWVALPAASSNVSPSFEHHPTLPIHEARDGRVTIFMGALGGDRSPATAYSPIVGAEVLIGGGGTITLPLDASFEHALFVTTGSAGAEGETLVPDVMYYLAVGRSELTLDTREGARVLLLGGPPFGERILMWWNFVARSHEELAAARDEWEAGGLRFGRVRGYDGPSVPAPALKGRAVPPGAS